MEMSANFSKKQSLRMRRALLLSSIVLAIISLLWGVYFVARGNWGIWPLNVASVAVAAGTAVLTLRGHIRAASVSYTHLTLPTSDLV